MKKDDVPQQGGLNAGAREINYAVDSDGQYTLEKSVGWEAKNVALRQAWQEIVDQLREVIVEIKAGRKSTLAYYMVKNQMDPVLLSHYSGVARWRVKRHLKPEVFSRLDSAVLSLYADLFGVHVDRLRTVPDEPDLPLSEIDQAEGGNS